MIQEMTDGELAQCLQKLRLIFEGFKAGGLRDWAYRSQTTRDVIQRAAACQTGEQQLTLISNELTGCTRCRLHSGRTNLVFGEGSAKSGLVFVGEGPGAEEDRQGRPFVGRAGKLLDKMIFAIGFERQAVYICNVVKCRPPENRAPQPDEAAACSPFLFRQIEALGPKVICALGLSAAQGLLGNTRPMFQLRGKVHIWRGIPLICTYHPAYLLRSPSQKAAAWQDLKEVLRVLRA
ncbi:MAG: uracil-DNA glycosylase [Syntrophobacteraceae bacterium]